MSDRRPNLEQLRNQARELLRQFAAADPDALARWDALFERGPEHLQLAHAQLVLAGEAGFPSWPRLKSHLERPRPTRRPRGPKRLPSRKRLEELYAYTLAMVARGDPAAFVLETPPGGPYGWATTALLRQKLLDSGELAAVADLIVRGLGHPNARVRYECAHLLDMLGDDRCVPGLTRLLSDPVPRVRAIALHSLVCDATCASQPSNRPGLDKLAATCNLTPWRWS